MFSGIELCTILKLPLLESDLNFFIHIWRLFGGFVMQGRNLSVSDLVRVTGL